MSNTTRFYSAPYLRARRHALAVAIAIALMEWRGEDVSGAWQ